MAGRDKASNQLLEWQQLNSKESKVSVFTLSGVYLYPIIVSVVILIGRPNYDFLNYNASFKTFSIIIKHLMVVYAPQSKANYHRLIKMCILL